ncbi:internalin, partial [[Clostridium] innocuum]|nr:internalin [[Clostridium] innocuum]
PKEKEAIVLSEEPLRVKKTVKREEKKEFEFSPVISPIFGSSEEESKPKTKSAAPLPQRSKKKNPLGTIISPYYGVGELEEFEAKAQEKIEEKEKLKKEELPQQEVEKYDLEEEINSVPLEDMIEKTPGEDGDDLMQISLFGESTPISSVDDASDKE